MNKEWETRRFKAIQRSGRKLNSPRGSDGKAKLNERRRRRTRELSLWLKKSCGYFCCPFIGSGDRAASSDRINLV